MKKWITDRMLDPMTNDLISGNDQLSMNRYINMDVVQALVVLNTPFNTPGTPSAPK